MLSMRRPAALVVTGIMLMSVISIGVASAQDEDGDTGDGNVIFTIGSTGEPTTFNPFKVYLALEYYPMAWGYHLPITFGTKELEAVPDFVIDTTVSEDGQTFTYTVRDDVVWSDGTPMTAEDMAWTFTQYKRSKAYLPIGYLRLVDRIEAIDDTHVELHSKQPTSLYAGDVPYIYAYILPKHIWSQHDKPKQFENLPTVGSGPFVTAEYKTGEFFRLVRNPHWTGPEPYIDEVIWRLFKSEDALAEGLKAGEIDFAYFSAPNIFNSLVDQPNIGSMVGSIPSFDEIGMNTGSQVQPETNSYDPHGDGHPALQDVQVRRAIRMAINSQELVDKVLLGTGLPGTTVVPPVSIPGARWEPTGEDLIAWDIDGANALLDEEGYDDCDGDGVREMPGCGQPLEFRYFTRTSDQTTIDAASFISRWLEQIGVKTDVQAVSSGRLGDIINAGEFDLFDWGWIPDPDPDSMLSYLTCDQRPPDGKSYGNNDSYYCNPDYDRLYEQQRTELDTEKRLEMIQEMQRIFYDDAAYAVKWYSPVLQAYRTDTFEGYLAQPQPEGDLLSGYSRDAILSIRPVGTGGGGVATRGISATVWLIAAGVVIVVLGLVLSRRRRPAEEDI